MGLKALAEGIILQSVDDLWDEGLREDSINFFKGSDFSLCAEIAGMDMIDQVKLLKMVKGIADHTGRKVSGRKPAVRQAEKRQRRFQRETVPSCV